MRADGRPHLTAMGIESSRGAIPPNPYVKNARRILTLHITMCRITHIGVAMPTNLAIDDRLLEEAQRVGRHRTKRETVTVALQEYIQHRKQQEILSLFGDIDYERGYDYKRERKAKRT